MSNTPLPLAEVLGHEASDKRIDILRRIGQAGSISEAARGAGVSYKAAWQALETLTNLAGLPLVDKAVGGSGGGGAALTAAGKQVLQAAQAMAEARRQVLAQLAAGGNAPGRAVLALRTSMRNQFPCAVEKVQRVGGYVRVTLRIANGQALNARITAVSAQLLGLKAGLEVLGMCKATALHIQAEAAAPGKGNSVAGTVSRYTRSPGGEVSLQLDNDIQLVGFAAAGFKPSLKLPALAVFDESSLVIGALN